MIATAHVIIGGTVGVLTKNPAAGFLAGVASHLICDAIPHLDGPLYPQYENGDKDKMIWTRGIFIFALADSLFAFLITLKNCDFVFFSRQVLFLKDDFFLRFRFLSHCF